MDHFAGVDWVIMIVVPAGMLALGIWLGRGQRSTRDYFLGSRNIPWWGVSLSIVATETSALTFIGVPSIAYGGNLMFLQIIIGYVIARVVLAIVLVPHYFKGDIYSPYQLIHNAFGQGARQTAGLFFLIAGTLAAGVRVYVTCIPIQLMFGLTELEVLYAILLFVGIALVYTWIGGVKSVIWTDAVQFLFLFGGGVFALFFLLTQIQGGWSEAISEAAAAGKTKWFNGSLSLSLPFNIWMGVIGATVQVMSSHGADQLNVQRVLACRNTGDGRKALILSALIIFPLMLVFLLVGVLLWVFYQHHPFGLGLPEGRPGMGSNDYVFPLFILSEIPPVMKGLLVVAIFSAALSSVSSALSALSSVSVMDLLKNWMPSARDETGWLKLSRRTTLVWGAGLVLVAWLSKEADSVLNLAFSLNGLTAGAMLGAMILALWWKQGPASPVIGGMILSLLAMIVVSRISWTVVVDNEEVQRSIGWPWFALIGTAVCLAAAVVLRQVVKVRSKKV